MSAETKFTPGPWRSVENTLGDYVKREASEFLIWSDDYVVAAVITDVPPKANAHLIAAAPKLYEALEKMLGEVVGLAEQHPDAVAALRKARGES